MAEVEIFEVPEIIPLVLGGEICQTGDCPNGSDDCSTGNCINGS